MRGSIVIGVLFLFSAAAEGAEKITVSNVTRAIHDKGARTVLRQIYKDDVSWSALREAIATGTPEWLKIAADFRKVSDAGASEQLELAVGEALEHRPTTVLRLATKTFPVEVICSGPDVDDTRYDSYTLSMRAISLRERKVAAITDAKLRKRRDACLTALEKSRKGIAQFYGKAKR